jgi:SAM-dependent methyltransferase
MSGPPVEVTAVDLYGEGLQQAVDDRSGLVSLRAMSICGERLPMALERYVGPVIDEDERALSRAVGPVLDIGCGPGRHVLALARRGMVAVGVDISPLAVRMARRRGAVVIEASIFGRLPGSGQWGSALLLDGNIGIGGQPAELLSRVRALLRPTGVVVVELDPPGLPTKTLSVRLEGPTAVSSWFPWARLGISDIDDVALHGGFKVADRWHAGERWFAELTPLDG